MSEVQAIQQLHSTARTRKLLRPDIAVRRWAAEKMGELRIALREWLGIHAVEDILDFQDQISQGIRRDLDAVAAAGQDNAAQRRASMLWAAELLYEIDSRGQLSEKSLAEVAKQHKELAGSVQSHAKLLKAWRGVGILANASRKALHEEQMAERKRLKEARGQVAGHIGKGPDVENPATSVATNDLLADAKQALVSGAQRPEGEGWESVWCQVVTLNPEGREMGSDMNDHVAGWWNSKQDAVKKPARAWCDLHPPVDDEATETLSEIPTAAEGTYDGVGIPRPESD